MSRSQALRLTSSYFGAPRAARLEFAEFLRSVADDEYLAGLADSIEVDHQPARPTARKKEAN